MRLHIIDDDLLVHKFYEILLDSVNSETQIESFYNGQDAINFLKKNKDNRELLPDVILLDINMPIMDGWTFLDHFDSIVWEMTRRPSIFIVTSCLMNQEELSTKNHVKGYHSKPLTQKQLIGILEIDPVSP